MECVFPPQENFVFFVIDEWHFSWHENDMKMIWAGLMGKYFIKLFLQLYSYIETSLIRPLDNKKEHNEIKFDV